LKRLLIAIFIALFGWTASPGQAIWPGDVNNNGVVDEVDVFYWAYAREARGPGRAEEGEAWQAFDPPENWPRFFPNGVNFAHADCNGDGVVDDLDLDVIRENFGLDRPDAVPDEFAPGQIGEDPSLRFLSDELKAMRGHPLEVPIALEDARDALRNVLGLSFIIDYDPALIKQGVEQGPKFSLDEESWLGMTPRDAQSLIFNDPSSGKTLVIIFHKRINNLPSGGGAFGHYIVVIEDIVTGLSTVDLAFEDIKVVRKDLKGIPIAPSEVKIDILDESVISGRSSPSEQPRFFQVFPNPTQNHLTIRWIDQNLLAGEVELCNTLGQTLLYKIFPETEQIQLDLPALPAGYYYLRLRTKLGVHTYPIQIHY
jgi:hypothetical protein